tara:strand:- start:1019 stop:1435 length:417 start_codon:yes stop_codon:yes gene_type:complete
MTYFPIQSRIESTIGEGPFINLKNLFSRLRKAPEGVVSAWQYQTCLGYALKLLDDPFDTILSPDDVTNEEIGLTARCNTIELLSLIGEADSSLLQRLDLPQPDEVEDFTMCEVNTVYDKIENFLNRKRELIESYPLLV